MNPYSQPTSQPLDDFAQFRKKYGIGGTPNPTASNPGSSSSLFDSAKTMEEKFGLLDKWAAEGQAKKQAEASEQGVNLFGQNPIGFGAQGLNITANLGIGAAKGAASTLSTPIRKGGAVGVEISELMNQGKYQEARDSLVEANDKLTSIWKKLPKDNPRRAKLQDMIKQNMDMFNDINTQSTQDRTKADELRQSIENPDILKAKGTSQKVGYGAEKLAEFIYGGAKMASNPMTVSNINTLAGSTAAWWERPLTIAAKSLDEGIAAGTVASAQGQSLGDITKASLLSTLFSIPFKAVGEYADPIAVAFRRSAEKRASQAFAATTKEGKRISEKVVPEALDRKILFLNRSSGIAKADKHIDDIGEKIGEAWDNLPDNTKVSITPVMNNLDEAKTALSVETAPGSGKFVVPDAAKGQYNAIQNIQDEILRFAQVQDDTAPDAMAVIKKATDSARQIMGDISPDDLASMGGKEAVLSRIKQNAMDALAAGVKDNPSKYAKYVENIKNVDLTDLQSADDVERALMESVGESADTVSAKTLRSYKQIVDTVISKSKKGFGMTGDETARLAAQKEGTNAIRNVLNSDNPSIAKLNAEYNFWNNFQKLLSTAQERTASQGSMTENVAEGAGAITGSLMKGTFGNVILAATGARLLRRMFNSPGWKMADAVLRSEIAEAIMSGNMQTLSQLANRVVSGVVSTPQGRE